MYNHKLVFYIKILVSIIISGAGLFFVLYPEKFGMIDKNIVIIIGILFIARGLFRAYSAYKDDFKREA